jgi:DNA-binding XRE family transcriptional regulator
MKNDWLWDKNVSEKQAIKILHDFSHPQFISLAALLLSRKNIPRDIFQVYLKPEDFCRHWKTIKQKMRRDNWNNPRIEFWKAVYEKLMEKYRAKGIDIFYKSKIKPVNEFCLQIGQRLRILRKQRKLTQEMLSKRLGISQQMISRIESGKENVSLLTLKKILDGLGSEIFIEGIDR